MSARDLKQAQISNSNPNCADKRKYRGKDLYYDPSISGLVSENLQDAVDEVSGIVGALDHNTDLSGLQGGNATERYHLTANQNTTLTTGINADALHIHSAGIVTYNNTTSGMIATNAQAAIDELKNVENVSGEITGFVNRTDSTLSFNNGTLTFAITPSPSFDFYIKGKKYTRSAIETIPITNTEGMWFFYYNSLGVLTVSQIIWDLSVNVPIAYIYWSVAGAKNIFEGVADERHGLTMDWATHAHLHYSIGTQYKSGLTLSGYNTLPAVPIDTDNTVGMSDGAVRDEDIEIDIKNNAVPTLPFEQILAKPAQIPVLYRTGAAGNWLQDAPSNFYFKYTAAGFINYNQFTGVTWQQTQMATNNYTCIWIFATNNQKYPIVSIQGQRTDTNLTNAQNNNKIETISFGTVPFQELKPLYRVIFQTNNGYGTTGKCRIAEVADLRAVSPIRSGTFVPISHSSLGDTNTNGHPATVISYDNTNSALQSTNIQDATDELASYGTNFIGNGKFDIWQRNTSFVMPIHTQYLTDRFRYGKIGTTATHTITQETDIPTLAQSKTHLNYSMKATVTLADAVLGAGDAQGYSTFLEGYDYAKIEGKKATLTFWVKSSLAGTYCIGFRNSGTDLSYIAEYTINTINTWEKKSITVDFTYAGGTWNYTNGVGLQIAWILMSGSNFHTVPNSWQAGNFYSTASQVNFNATLGNTFFLANIKLNIGNKETMVITRTISEELSLCQRYFEKSYNTTVSLGSNTVLGATNTLSNGVVLTNNNNLINREQSYMSCKRITPLVTVYDNIGNINKITVLDSAGASTNNWATYGIANFSEKVFAISGQGGGATPIYGISYHWASDAEFY